MSASAEWAEVERLFDEALDQPTGERSAWLAAATEDPAIRELVTRMLQAHDRPSGPLDRAVSTEVFSLGPRLEAALGDRYSVSAEIGRGGMATVYLAHERKHNRPVVLKVLNPDAAVAFGTKRFLAEIHVAAQLSHPHILALLDSGEVDDLLYYVMPYIGGETLRARLRRERRLAPPVARQILADLADALATAHRAGVVHRDLKPENILLVGDHAYLLDFGIAQLRMPEGEWHTGQGAVLGTMGYMAPEQSVGGATDHRADLFAWGVLGREMLTGQHPGVLSSLMPATLPTETPTPLAAAIERCLAAEPVDRPPDAETLLALVGGTTGDPGPTTPTIGGTGRRIGAAALALVALAVLGWIGMRRRSDGVVHRLALPVIVAPLVNETGDSSLTAWGRMAGDWITQGLQENGGVTVVPWPTAREADERYRLGLAEGAKPDQVRFLSEDAGAGTVITGAYYLTGGRVHFQAQITDAATGTLLAHPEPAEAPRDSADAAVRQLRSRVMGALAVWRDTVVGGVPGLAERPPTFEAYRAFDRGVSFHLGQDYDSAVVAFRQAFALDSTFGTALVYAATDLWNRGDFAGTDSVLRLIRDRKLQLSEYQELSVAYLGALLAGDGDRAYTTMRRARDLTQDSRGMYAVAWIAIATNRPAEALTALRALNPDRGMTRRWSPYWLQRTHAEHELGLHQDELASSREMRRRFPESRLAPVLEVRAAAAAGNTALVDSLLAETAGLSRDTYWSQGAAMVVAGEELAAHGRGFAASGYFTRAVSWLANELTREPSHRAHRYWIGSALYDAGRWPEAEPYFASLVHDFPERFDYHGLYALAAAHAGRPEEALRRLGPRPAFNPGAHTAFRARLAAIEGHPDEAVALLAQAASEAYDGWPWLHSTAYRDFGPFASDPRFQALLGPALAR